MMVRREMKHIRFADRSENGLSLINEYQSDDLTSDSDGERKYKVLIIEVIANDSLDRVPPGNLRTHQVTVPVVAVHSSESATIANRWIDGQ